jgi:hypothetical protein
MPRPHIDEKVSPIDFYSRSLEYVGIFAVVEIYPMKSLEELNFFKSENLCEGVDFPFYLIGLFVVLLPYRPIFHIEMKKYVVITCSVFLA